MAERTVSHIAMSLLQQLSSPAKDEFLLLFYSKAELKKLKNTITCIKGVLHDAEQKKATNADVGGWLSRLQDEMYQADDLFDTISTRALKKKVISGNKFKKDIMVFFSKSNQAAFVVKTAHKVKELREQLDDIAKDISHMGLIRSAIEYDQRIQGNAMKRRAQHSFIAEDEVIGREEDKQELLKLLMADNIAEERVSVIAVVGIGGQGKTAIAQLLYNAKEIEDFFEVRLWACINYFSDLKEVLEEMTCTKSHSLDELQNRLRAEINGKKFLLVIDDVWDDIREQWLHVKRLLYAGESGSKVLITTRSQTVVQNLATGRDHYALEELSDEDGWILFKKMAFDCIEGEADQIKEELGRQIFKKCPKVPLALRTVGSFLYSKDKKQWSAFVDNELMKAMPDRENIVMQVLKISYDDLPSSLKHCFAYCSLFPKDHKFYKTTLIHLWMAQGLLEISEENPWLEKVGESYFLYLLDRGFFQNVVAEDDGAIFGCKMHDLFHDLAVQIDANECQAMLKVTDELGRKLPRHLLIKDIKGMKGLVPQCKGLRSLVCLVTGFVERRLLDVVLLKLTSLRTLILRQLDAEEIPSSIGKLAHLRYLDLMKSEKLIKLPDALCKLQNLLILRLEGCKNLIKLPDDLQKLISLRCLTIDGCDKLDHIPSGLEGMTSLVTLDRLIVHNDHGGLRCLKLLNNLTGDICIELPSGGWKNCVDDAEECKLSRKTKLSRLSILWSSITEAITEAEEFPKADVVLDRLQPSDNISYLKLEGFPGVKFPNWLSSLHNLVQLIIYNCSRCSELPQLQHLFQLKTMYLMSIPFLEYVANDTCYDNEPFFPSLEYLFIDGMPRLKGWWRPKGEEVCGGYHDLWFPRLSSLAVYNCPQLTSLPLCPFVESIQLNDVSGNLVTHMMRLPKVVELEPNRLSAVSTPNILHTSTCSKLIYLILKEINDLALLPDDFKNLTFLRTLSIRHCPSFKESSLFCLLQNMPSLEILCFVGCDTAECLVDDFANMGRDNMQWSVLTRLKLLEFGFRNDSLGGHLFKGLHHLTRLEHLVINMTQVSNNENMQGTTPPNLKYLSIEDMDKVVGLNRFIHQLKNLRCLYFTSCSIDEHELNKLPWEDLKGLGYLSFTDSNSLKSLPEKCQHLLALEDLGLYECEEIISLPSWVSRLTSLTISKCSKLKEACRKPMGSCWPLIQDIPYVSIRDE